MQSKLSAYNRLLYLQDVLYKPHDNKANTKTYNRFTKDKDNQSILLQKIMNSQRQAVGEEEMNKKTIKQPENS